MSVELAIVFMFVFNLSSDEQESAVAVGLIVQVPLLSVNPATTPSVFMDTCNGYVGVVVPTPTKNLETELDVPTMVMPAGPPPVIPVFGSFVTKKNLSRVESEEKVLILLCPFVVDSA